MGKVISLRLKSYCVSLAVTSRREFLVFIIYWFLFCLFILFLMFQYLCTDTNEYIVAQTFLFFKFSGNFITHFPFKFDLSVSVHPLFNLFFYVLSMERKPF